MTVDQIRQLVHAEPFVPFELHLANGRAVRVPSREMLLAPPSGRTIAVYDAGAKAIEVIELLLATNIKLPA